MRQKPGKQYQWNPEKISDEGALILAAENCFAQYAVNNIEGVANLRYVSGGAAGEQAIENRRECQERPTHSDCSKIGSQVAEAL